MVEPRRKRADFLRECIDSLALSQATVVTGRVESMSGRFGIISARAVASVEKLLQAAGHCATPDTQWILPRGRIEPHDIDRLRRDPHRLFHVKQSVTDSDSMILVIKRNKDAGR
jgi:16S rRNA (guanine527-N7)-methyltransferase